VREGLEPDDQGQAWLQEEHTSLKCRVRLCGLWGFLADCTSHNMQACRNAPSFGNDAGCAKSAKKL
jgi:hypothetical protein